MNALLRRHASTLAFATTTAAVLVAGDWLLEHRTVAYSVTLGLAVALIGAYRWRHSRRDT